MWYLNDVGGKSNVNFEGCEGLWYEEVEQPQNPIVGEVLGRTFASDGENVGRASVSVGEDLDGASASVGEDIGGTSSSGAAYNIPEIASDWESETKKVII